MRGDWCTLMWAQVSVVSQYKYHTVGSLQAKTIVTCVRIFGEPSKTLESNWPNNSDIVSGFELFQMIAIVPKFYKFCLHLTKLSPSPFFTPEMLKGTIFHSCLTPNVTWLSFGCAFQINIKLVISNPSKFGLWFAPFVTSLVYDVTKLQA